MAPSPCHHLPRLALLPPRRPVGESTGISGGSVGITGASQRVRFSGSLPLRLQRLLPRLRASSPPRQHIKPCRLKLWVQRATGLLEAVEDKIKELEDVDDDDDEEDEDEDDES